MKSLSKISVVAVMSHSVILIHSPEKRPMSQHSFEAVPKRALPCCVCVRVWRPPLFYSGPAFFFFISELDSLN